MNRTHSNMERTFVIILLLIAQANLSAQEQDTLKSIPGRELDEVIVTAVRRAEPLSHLAYNITIVSENDITSFPTQNFDDIFNRIAGINQDRKNGIFTGSKSIINLSGITGGEQGRVLVLEDGVPLNISDNGEVNWNRLNLSDYSRIEIIKGPASSLYGSNAMGGIINLVSCMPVNPFQLRAGLFYGSYHTARARLDLSGKEGKFFWKTALNYQRSDGYIMPPDSLRDSSDVPTFLNESGIRIKLGYHASKNLLIDASYNFYDDKHGYGIEIVEPGGGYTSHSTHFGRVSINFDNRKWFGNMNLFYNQEEYYKLIEKLKDTIYSAIDVNSKRIDAGLLTYGGRRFESIVVSLGADLRAGSTNGADDYITSSDIVTNQGSVSQLSTYLLAETGFLNNKMKLSGSLNYTAVLLNKAIFTLTGTTNETAYMTNFAENFHDTLWSSLNPSFNLKYNPAQYVVLLLGYSHGFRTPTIDDLTRSGMINIGFKEANPLLKPEKIDHYQVYARIHPVQTFFVSTTAYYSKGLDYIYYRATGETVFGGRRLVYRKDNINELESVGIEFSMDWQPNEWIHAYANMLFDRSIILSNEVLQGKSLPYSPAQMLGFGITSVNRFMDGSVNWQFKGKQYIDDENSISLPAHSIINLQLSKTIANHYKISFTMQNLLNKTYLFDGRNLTLGRTLNAGFEYIF
jgi:iron complex outermembrane recepter protein